MVYIRLMLTAALLMFLGFVAWLYFHQRAVAATAKVLRGGAVVNALGTVVEWSPEAATVTGQKDMIGRDIFSLLPPARRDREQRRFTLAQDGPQHPFPSPAWPIGEKVCWLKFEPIGNHRIAATLGR